MIFRLQKSELLTKNEEKVFIRTVDFLEKLWIELRGETGSEDKTENNKAVEISEKDTYERAKQLLQRRLTVWKLRQNISLRRFRMFLILWKLPLVIARKW